MSGAKIRSTFPRGRRAVRRAQAKGQDPQSVRDAATRLSRAARMLALAHHVERLIGAGALSGYAEAAHVLGLTRARLTQVMNLLMLAPAIQEQILVGTFRGSERQLRPIGQEPNWAGQAIAAR